ncbi:MULTISPECIES: hypothetical protein [Clostridium]|uniref:Uncharacterized protein n=1 Tax=Clostridium saudiense TaxID=1414720 RepID=A0ABS2FLS5_9CLOT|nr:MULTISPECIES: hypothetical protein [Clostridium]MBM6820848.1 hypothetical protein [Clostridium saudiense]
MNNEKPHEYLALRDTGYMTINSVIDSSGIVDNDIPIRDFFENIGLNYPSKIIIEKYTLEGEPSFKIIEFNGKKIKYIYDLSKTIDKTIKTYKGNNYKIRHESNSIYYDLYNNNKFVINMIYYQIKKI